MRPNPLLDITATCTAGLEMILEGEINRLGEKLGLNLQAIHPGRQAISFKGDLKALYAANLHLRTAILILRPIRSFQAHSPEELYDQAYEMPWETILDPTATFSITSSVQSRRFAHSKYVTLKLKDAVVDRIRKQTGSRPDVNQEEPDLHLHLHIHDDRCTISLNSSGAPLFKRGYRSRPHQASLNEALAAGLVLLSGWDGREPFIDPMTGSGTIAIEAALFAAGIAPGLFRANFAFMNWPDFDAKLWEDLRREALSVADRALAHPAGIVFASDSSPAATDNASENIKNAGLAGWIHLQTKPFDQLQPPAEKGMILMNPPYGERLHKADIDSFYRMIGDTLKQHFSGYTAWVFSSNFEAMKLIGLHASKRIVLHNGPLECKLQKYELYSGTRRTVENEDAKLKDRKNHG